MRPGSVFSAWKPSLCARHITRCSPAMPALANRARSDAVNGQLCWTVCGSCRSPR